MFQDVTLAEGVPLAKERGSAELSWSD